MSPAARETKRLRDAARYQANKEKHRAERLLRRAEISAKNAAWYKANREAVLAAAAAHYAANAEKLRAAKRAWRKANPDKDRAIRTAFKLAHPGYFAARAVASYKRDPRRTLAYLAIYRKTNRASLRVLEARRRARKRNAPTEPFTAAELDAHLDRLGRRCVYCRGPYEHLDHVMPLSRGGAHALSNLVPACKSCNLRKHNKLPHVWAAEQRS